MACKAIFPAQPCRRSGNWFDREHVFAFCGILLAIELGVFVFLIAGTHGWIVPLAEPASTDFVSFYAAGSLTDAGQPELAYDQPAHRAAEERATEPGIQYRFFYYPPVFLLLCSVLARFPYIPAFVIFEAASLALYLVVARRILQRSDWGTLVVLMAPPAVFWTLGLGQNAFLTAALFGAGTLLIDRRPVVAGLLLGALCYKPHLGLLVPVALIAGSHWRALAAAGTAVAGLCALSLILFGWSAWHDFLAEAVRSHATYESGKVSFGGLVTPFGAVLSLGGSASAAYAVQAAFTLLAVLLVFVVWCGRRPLPIRAAVLAAATLVAIPVALLYDLMLAAIAVLWLARHNDRLSAADKIVIAVSMLLCLDPRSLAETWHIPAAPLVAITILALAAIRAFRPESSSNASVTA
jgi:alpha-1,2-mannosyltransferase